MKTDMTGGFPTTHPITAILIVQYISISKVVSATFLLVCFVCLKEGTCETRKNVFYFTSEALFILEIIKLQFLKYSNVMMSSNA